MEKLIALCAISFMLTEPSVRLSAQTVPTGTVPLKEGTEVRLKFDEDVSSKTANEGDAVNFVLEQDLRVGDTVVVRAGSKAVAEVTHAKKAGHMGKGGELNIRIQHLMAGDTRVRLRGSKGREGESKEGTAIVLTVLFGPIGLLKHGKNIEVKQGTPLTTYVDQDINLPPIGESAAAVHATVPAVTPAPAPEAQPVAGNEPRPLAKSEILDLLKGQVPSARVVELVKQRNINFNPTEEDYKEIRTAGGGDDLISVLKAEAILKQ